MCILNQDLSKKKLWDIPLNLLGTYFYLKLFTNKKLTYYLDNQMHAIYF